MAERLSNRPATALNISNTRDSLSSPDTRQHTLCVLGAINTHTRTAEMGRYFRAYYMFRPPLWSSGQRSSGQSFWLQIQRPGFDSWRYQIF
jgi:hypothetical protein